jgi:hypothetical protein
MRQPSASATAALAAAFVIFSMTLLFKALTGPASGDWLGYAQLYSDQGGWLLDQKRDPGFLLILNCAHSMFGRYGYSYFRIVLSIIFTAFATWLVCSIPIQSRLPQLSSVVAALIVVSAFSLKSFVQIREGLAFLFIVAPTVAMFARHRSGILISGLGALAALTFHSGTIVLGITWLVALALTALSDHVISSRLVHRILLATGLATGATIGALTIFYTDDVRFFLGSYGVNLHAKAIGGLNKDLYWLLNGIIALKIRNDVLRALVGISRFAFCYATALASIAIPMMYAVCVTLVLFDFATPALTSIMIRLFFTVTELGMILIALRGRGNISTALIATFMLIDRIRVVGESS